jgi:hypothetical protein
MGLFIALETESGEKIQSIEDTKNILHQLLPLQVDESYKLLRFVDWYGDTIFNRIQMEALIADITLLLKKVHSQEEIDLMLNIVKMCKRCSDEQHLYVKIYGD